MDNFYFFVFNVFSILELKVSPTFQNFNCCAHLCQCFDRWYTKI